MSDPAKAVFLSYASQDAEPARRIADALHSFGVEVWFDQDELRGGDAWDAKIRRQIRECGLFVPVISATTQTRSEGYFRREWKLAIERTQDMAEDLPFLVPVAIDDSADAQARVPEKFREVQWTRLPAGETPPEFCARMLSLLSGEAAAVGSAVRPAALPSTNTGRPFGSRPSFPTSTNPGLPTAAAEAQRYLVQARKLIGEFEDGNLGRDNLDLADELCQKALQLESASAEAWALAAQVSVHLHGGGHDRSAERWNKLHLQAGRAIKLAPDSAEAQYACALSLGTDPRTAPEAERVLRDLIGGFPTEKRFLRLCGAVLQAGGKSEESLAAYERADRLPGGDPMALLGRADTLLRCGRDAQAEREVNRSLAQRPSEAAYVKKFEILVARGDLAGMCDVVSVMPPVFLRNDNIAYCAALAGLGSRDARQARLALAGAPSDYFSVRAPLEFEGPKAYLEALTYELEGSHEAAQAKWELARQGCEQHLAREPDNAYLLLVKAEILARLGRVAEAERTQRLAQQLEGSSGLADAGIFVMVIGIVLGRHEEMITQLEALSRTGRLPRFLRTVLRLDLRFDPLRGNPRFEALLAEPRNSALV